MAGRDQAKGFPKRANAKKGKKPRGYDDMGRISSDIEGCGYALGMECGLCKWDEPAAGERCRKRGFVDYDTITMLHPLVGSNA